MVDRKLEPEVRSDYIYLYDTTLRDGAQTTGVDFSIQDKISIAEYLDDINIDYVEGGWPGANPTDSGFFAQSRTSRSRQVAFGMTKRAGRSISNQAAFREVIEATSDACCLVAKAWDYHVTVALGISLEENLEAIDQSVRYGVECGKEMMIDCEHFFDGYNANPEYALACLETAYNAGARWTVLCDTNGGTLPAIVADITTTACALVPGTHIGIHAQNDTGNAVAVSLAAVDTGVRQIQGTINGLGERCGNADLCSIIPNLALKTYFSSRFKIGMSESDITKLTDLSRALNRILDREGHFNTPYVGRHAFSHKGGLHASAILKAPQTYEHVPPAAVGNKRRILVSDQAGKASVISELSGLGYDIDKNDTRLDAIIADVKERKELGYAYEDAEASFALLARKHLDLPTDFYGVDTYNVQVEQRYNAAGIKVTVARAVVKLRIGDHEYYSVAEGNGPVNALDIAIRKDLGKYQKYVDDLELVDYRVRILNQGTDAITRVILESRNKDNLHWRTTGVSTNIVDASFEALDEAIRYKLIISGAQV